MTSPIVVDKDVAATERAKRQDRTYLLTLPRIVELLCQEGLADIERNEPQWNRGRMLARNATGVRRVEEIARKNGISLNRTSLINLLPDRDKITRNPSVKRTLQGIKQMLDLWTIVDPDDPESRRIQFKSAGELADLHANTYDSLISDDERLRRELKGRLDDLDVDSLRQVDDLIDQMESDDETQSLRQQLDRLIEGSEQLPIMRLAMVLQSHLSRTSMTKLSFAQSVAQYLDDVDEVTATQRALDAIETLLSSIAITDDVEALRALLQTIATQAAVPNEDDIFDDSILKLVDYCGFAVV